MKKYNLLYIGCLTAALSITSCDVDLLNIPQEGVISEDNFYKTDDDCNEAITAVYNSFRNTYSGDIDWRYCNGFYLKNMLADDLYCGGAWDQPAPQELAQSVTTTTNEWVKLYYRELYSTIYLANIVLEKFDESSDIKKRNIAEAKFFRAICYFELVTLWGNPPLVDHVLTASEYEQPNSTEEALYSFIEQDLNEAINSGALVSKINMDDKDTGARVTREAAHAFLGKVYLYQGKYAEAKEQLKAVIDSQKYDLVDDITILYHMAGNGCKEYIFENVRHNDSNNLWGGVNGGTGQSGAHQILGNWPFAISLFMGPEALSHYNFCPQGYAKFNPTAAIYNAFVEEEGESGYRLTNWIKTWDQVVAMNVYMPSSGSSPTSEGYYRLKWLPTQDDENVSDWSGARQCFPVMRYADVLLMMAEACVQTGTDQAVADECVNKVRTRARLASKSNVTMDDIKKERQLELCMEGVRFLDLRRWGDAPTVLADKGKRIPTFRVTPDPSNDYTTAEGIYNAKYDCSIEWADNDYNYEASGWTPNRDEYLPYPQDELNANSQLKQNPGY
ncbi:RagB/SusD family nutrient uptake outer membrane protein [uncultured Bacteroides sp.]|uniref:RagB/SusD family nutrient uptake outer membrane protein n=1 Tax=uncultured Bacteroides sp. TaxID=162156 RepID=UPI00260BD062|nr:RagB/SusD family nutrient uptake outer membrane protein [uncultured Bacteroides sp.]